MRCVRNYSCALLCLAAFITQQAPPPQAPTERLRALIVADGESAKLAPDRWPDLSLKALRERETLDRTTLDQLHAVARKDLPREDRTIYDLFEWRLNRRLEQFRLRLYLTPFWNDDRYVGFAGVLGTADTFSQVSGAKVESFPGHVSQVVRLLREGIQARMLPSAELVRSVSEGCFDSVPTATARGSGWDEARKAAKDFCEFLSKEYLPACPLSRSLSRWPSGGEVYRELSRRFTTTDLDPKQIHDFGVAEVARIRGEMLPVIAQTGYKGSLEDFLKFARTAPGMYFSDSDDLLAAYRAALARIEPLVPTVIGHIRSRHLKVEPYQGNVAAMWYAPRPGQSDAVVLVAVNNPAIHPKFEILPLMLHEGMPGHELQHAVADERHVGDTDPISTFERNVGQNVAFAEGWALYAEGLGTEMGLYRDPYDKFGELRMELTRAVRLVIDTGIHADGWTESRATEYFLAATGKPETEVDSEISRTLWPGSQLAYKVGQSRIQRLRDETSRTLGAQFDLRAFHDAILRWGPLPLDILERKLGECLEAPGCSAELRKR